MLGIVSKQAAFLLVHLANALSLIRLFAVPVIVVLIWRSPEDSSSRFAAFWLVACLHAADMLDGYLARKGSRRLAVRNYFGEMVDPIADKMYIGAAYITLAVTDQVPDAFAVLVIVRDSAIIVGWTVVYRRFGVRLLPNSLGKVTDAGLAVLLCAILLPVSAAHLGVMTSIAAALMIASGIAYGHMAARAGSRASFRRLRSVVAARRDRAAANRIRSAP